MKFGYYFDFAVEKYFKNIIINLLFSAIMMFGFYVKSQLIMVEIFSGKTAMVLMISEFLSVSVTAIFTSCIMRSLPKRIVKLIFVALLWSVAFFAESLLVRKVYGFSAVNGGIMLAVCAVVYGIILGTMILSLCDCIKDSEVSFPTLIVKNLWFIIKAFAYGVFVVVAASLIAFIPVNTRGGRKNLIIVPEQKTIAGENRIFPFIVFFAFPLYTLIFIEVFEAITYEDTPNPSD